MTPWAGKLQGREGGPNRFNQGQWALSRSAARDSCRVQRHLRKEHRDALPISDSPNGFAKQSSNRHDLNFG
jgi:hypothetical protein